MGYYTIWLAPVKRYFVPFWEGEMKTGQVVPTITAGNSKPDALQTEG
jgi:hypothetical protein